MFLSPLKSKTAFLSWKVVEVNVLEKFVIQVSVQDALQTAAARYQLVDKRLQEVTSLLDKQAPEELQTSPVQQAVHVSLKLELILQVKLSKSILC